jgi:Tfp pilus assembly protein PilF
MNTPLSRLLSIVIASALVAAAPVAFASGGGGFMQPTLAPSQSAPKFDSASEFRRGVESLKAEKYAEAEESFGHVLYNSPRDANANLMMGLAQGGQGKLADARDHFERAIKYDDNLILAHMELGVVLAKQGKTDKANAVLDDLKKRAVACAGTCEQAEQLKSAVSNVGAAIAPAAAPDAPTSPAPAASPASPASPATSQVPAEQELLNASIASGDHAYLDAVALIHEKRYPEAILALKASARVFGPHPDILTYLGYVNRKMGKLDVAEDYYRQALAAAPNHLGATEYYGELMVERGDIAGAKQMLGKLETVCHFGCAQEDELRRWIVAGKQPSS